MIRAALAIAGASVLAVVLLRRPRRPGAAALPDIPSQMSAVVVRQNRCVLVHDWETPKPGEDDVLIRVRTTAINRLDVSQRLGKAPVPKGATEVLGLEAAGVVVAVGARASERFALGDEVMALATGGGYAQYVCVHAATVMHKPPALSWSAAGSIPEACVLDHPDPHLDVPQHASTTDLLPRGPGPGPGPASPSPTRGYAPLVSRAAPHGTAHPCGLPAVAGG